VSTLNVMNEQAIRNVIIMGPCECRQADLERMKDYQKELKEIQSRVTARPFLFEQVSQVH